MGWKRSISRKKEGDAYHVEVSVSELAKMQRVGVSTVYKWIHKYGLPFYQYPESEIRIDLDEYREWHRQFRSVKRQRVQRLVAVS